MTPRLFTALLLLTISSLADAGTSMWKVTDAGGHAIYLGGTIHLLRQSDYPLPKAYDTAYAASDELVLETDVAAIGSPEMTRMIFDKGLLPDGKTLRTVLDEATFKALSDYCATVKLPVIAIERFKPSLAMMNLLMIALRKHGAAEAGIDMFYYGRAKRDGKAIAWLEKPEVQIEAIVSSGGDDPNKMVMQSLEEMKSLDTTYDAMIKAWRTGDLPKLDQMMVQDTKKETPKDYQAMFVNRNNAWLPQIVQRLNDGTKSCILVGTGHLVGEDGLLALLKKQGFTVEQVAED